VLERKAPVAWGALDPALTTYRLAVSSISGLVISGIIQVLG
jgi:hypothetical protein